VTLNVQNVHRWLTNIPAVACDSLSQSWQWLSLVTQIKLTKVHFKTPELVSASVAAFVKTPAFLSNMIIQWIEVGWIGATHISDEVKAIWLDETLNWKR